jgi:octaprenyl-diphosphate synthase
MSGIPESRLEEYNWLSNGILLILKCKNRLMSELDQIKEPISSELKQFDRFFRDVMKTNVPLLNIVIQYLLKRKGKQMRPILVFLVARLLGKPTSSTFTAAALIEILHTATLVHDDVVDESYERRGFFSINAIWRSKVAVLLGDYLLAKGLLLSVEHKEYELLNIVADAVKEMSEGELMQIKNVRKVSVTQEEYFEIIRKKTATLISCCSSCGAKSVGMTDEVVKEMQKFGEWLGIAFQIKDDLLDYQVNNETGKPLGNDLKESKMTLPLIYALEKSESTERKKIIRLIHKGENGRLKMNEIRAFINKYQGLEYAEKKMTEYADMALRQIEPYAQNEISVTIRQFVHFTIYRNK